MYNGVGDLGDLRSLEHDLRGRRLRCSGRTCRVPDCQTDLTGGSIGMLRHVRHMHQRDGLCSDQRDAER